MGDREASKHTTCGWPFQQMDIASSAWTKPFPSLPEHTLLFYSEVPIPTCLAPRSPVAGCGLGFLKSQDSYPRLPPWRIPMHLQGPGHPSSLPFGKALPRPFCSSVCHQAGTSGTHVTTCPLLMEKSLTKSWLWLCCSCWDGGEGWDHGPNSSYRDLAGEQVQLSSDIGIVPLALYLNSTYQCLTFYTETNVRWEWFEGTGEVIFLTYVHSFQRPTSTGLNISIHRKLLQSRNFSSLSQLTSFKDRHWLHSPSK